MDRLNIFLATVSWLQYPEHMDSIEENLRRHVSVLCDEIGSRSILEKSNLIQAQEYIHEQFADVGMMVRVQDYTAHGVSTANLIAAYGDFQAASSFLLLGAHYDTVPGTPGADDNASAVAVMLETARLCASTRHTTSPAVLFAAFSTEEPPSFNSGQMGSRVFVRSLSDLDITVEAALILEMVGYFSEEPGSQKIPIPLKFMGFPDTGSFIAVVGNGRSRTLVKEVSSAMIESGCGLPIESLTVPGAGALLPEVRLSDNASFWDGGISAVMITDTSFFRNPHYHTSADRPDTLDYGKMGQLVCGLVHYLRGE